MVKRATDTQPENNQDNSAQYQVNLAKQATAIVVLAHGAGANMHHSFMETMTAGLNEQHISVVRFNFPYMIKRSQDGKRRPPDRLPKLVACYQEHLEQLHLYLPEHHQHLPIFIGGKSMGGRVAATLASKVARTELTTKTSPEFSLADLPDAVKGLICIGYPFHPAKKPEKLRLSPLENGQLASLIIQGERDPLGNQAEINQYDLPKNCQVNFLADGDHDLKPRVKSGFSHQQHLKSAIRLMAEFISHHSPK